MISFSWLALSVTFGATSPKGRGLGKKIKFAWTAKGPTIRGNNNDRRQWRKQGGVVGAAASNPQVHCTKWMLGAATRMLA